MAGPVDMSELHFALDRVRSQLCHCGFKGECLGCKGIDMVRAQAEAVPCGSQSRIATRCPALAVFTSGVSRSTTSSTVMAFTARTAPRSRAADLKSNQRS